MSLTQILLIAVLSGAVVGLALGWLHWLHRPAQAWPDWSQIPFLCMRCGADLPVRQRVEARPGLFLDVEFGPVGMSCEATGIAGWLCGPVCAKAWNDNHHHVHHQKPENHT